jgi:imidazolonepropionase-like amidohydrolase
MSETTLFRNATVITMSHPPVLTGVDIEVRQGRIVGIAEGAGSTAGRVAQVIDCTGKYLIPGLCDMHAHLLTENDLALYIPNGVTTIRNMWGEPAFNEWRDKINQGEKVGPTVYNFGQIMDGDPPVRPADAHNVTVRTPEEARSEVLRMKAEGYDFIKVYSMLSPEAFSAIAETCAEVGMKFGGHPPQAVGCSAAARAGLHSIEHMVYVGMDDVELLAELGTWICPTIIVQNMMDRLVEADAQALLQDDRLRYIDASSYSMWEMSLKWVETMKDKIEQMDDAKRKAMEDWSAKSKYSYAKPIVLKAYRQGCKLILGTDTPNPFVYPGFSVHEELELLVDCGLSPLDALKTATYNAAECLGTLGDTGTIAPGKVADLLLLEGNPLEDIKHTARIAGVMKMGRWYDRAALDKMLTAVEQACADTRK